MREEVTDMKKVTVEVTLTIEIEQEVPDDFSQDDCDFKFNESCWCASNCWLDVVSRVNEMKPKGECLCSSMKFATRLPE